MRALTAKVTLMAVCFLACYSVALAQQEGRQLLGAQLRVYHECLTAAWIQDYCRWHAWGMGATYDRTYAACVVANRGGAYLSKSRSMASADEYCWAQAGGALH
jgi:hypothetical protein